MDRIFDFHAHIYPEKIAAKAVEAIGSFYSIKIAHNGTPEELIECGKKSGVIKYLVHSTATRPEQVQSINNYVSAQTGAFGEFIGFGTLHPHMEDIEEEVNRLKDLKLSGVKLHPDFQNFALDAPEAFKLFDAMRGKLPLLVHIGDQRSDRSSPIRLKNVLDNFPDLEIVAAHMGGYSVWEQAAELLGGYKNLYLDTSSSLPFITPQYAVELIKFYGVEKILFGTDYPMWDVKEELERFYRLELSPMEQKMILYDNAARLLKIE